jgi:hypothetical protein
MTFKDKKEMSCPNMRQKARKKNFTFFATNESFLPSWVSTPSGKKIFWIEL